MKKAKKYKLGMARRLRETLRRMDDPAGAAWKAIVRAVNPWDDAEEKSLVNARNTLLAQGDLVQPAPGRYRLVKDSSRRDDKRRRVARAMHVQGVFTTKTLRVLTDADPSYIQNLLRRWERMARIQYLGMTPDGKQYRIADRDAFFIQYVKKGDFSDIAKADPRRRKTAAQ